MLRIASMVFEVDTLGPLALAMVDLQAIHNTGL